MTIMSAIDWSSPQVGAAIVGGIIALLAAVTTALIQRAKSKEKAAGQSQQALLSKDVQQVQAQGDVTITTQPPAKATPRKPSK